jgi:hypothetical protein
LGTNYKRLVYIEIKSPNELLLLLLLLFSKKQKRKTKLNIGAVAKRIENLK